MTPLSLLFHLPEYAYIASTVFRYYISNIRKFIANLKYIKRLAISNQSVKFFQSLAFHKQFHQFRKHWLILGYLFQDQKLLYFWWYKTTNWYDWLLVRLKLDHLIYYFSIYSTFNHCFLNKKSIRSSGVIDASFL